LPSAAALVVVQPLQEQEIQVVQAVVVVQVELLPSMLV
jgi:hypothetical protein